MTTLTESMEFLVNLRGTIEQKMSNPDATVRDVMLDRMLSAVVETCPYIGMDALGNLAIELSDIAFSVCGISDKEQEEAWKE